MQRTKFSTPDIDAISSTGRDLLLSVILDVRNSSDTCPRRDEKRGIGGS